MRRLSAFVTALVMLTACAWAGPERGHPNIIAARVDVEHALASLQRAQQAHDYDLNGHAAKAEQLLVQALTEMRYAAEVANWKEGR